MQTSSRYSRWIQNQLILAVALMALAGILLVVYADAALEWREQPFLGFLPQRTLEVDVYQSVVGAEWPALEKGLLAGDRITQLDGKNIGLLPIEERAEAFNDIVHSHEPGDVMGVGFERRDEVSKEDPVGVKCSMVPDTSGGLRTCRIAVTLTSMPDGDWFSYFGIGWFAGAVLWIIALVLLIRRGHAPLIQLIVMLSATVTIYLGGSFDAISTHRLPAVWLGAGFVQAALLAIFALEFPYRFAAIQRNPLLRWAPVVIALALTGAAWGLYSSSDSNLSRGAIILVEGALVIGGFMLIAMMGWRRSRSASPIARNQSTIVMLGLTPWLMLAVISFGWRAATGSSQPNLLFFTQALPILFPLSAVYAVLQFRLVDTDRFITQALLYAALVSLLLLSYWMIVAGIALLLGRGLSETALSPVMIAFSIFVIALIFMPLRAFLQRRVDALYFRARHAYQMQLEKFAREVTNAATLRDVISLVQKYLNDTLQPTHIILFARDVVTYEYRPEIDPVKGYRPTDITFVPESGLIRYLRDRASVLDLEEAAALPLEVVSERAKLAVLGAPMLVGLKGQKALNGFLAIGPRRNGAAYLFEDKRFIDSLSDQIALAVERAQAVEDLERRVRVQDVLSQVSRALNFAIDFDTLLELIYAQTSRVINAPNFYIALRNPNTDELAYVFFNEGDERDESMEGRRWRIGRDLMSEIARTQQTIRTDDYVRETLQRDPQARLDNPNLKAWMGVPLLADTGGGVLGVMVAATTEPGITFTDEQQDLFWDIANLAASALDKLQLFDKTQQRARQLAAINQISSQLAAELGSVDRLLQLITENAVQILNCEAGSLLLVDEETSDLVFRVVVGGGGEELINTRIPAGSGLAGSTVQRGVSIIVNDPSRDSRWYGDVRGTNDGAPVITAGDGRGENFHSNAILSVPLLVQGRAIGVLQTINKRDGSIFIKEDADLLETFAGQAAIAIENARLFDMTDQQLALRVQELDTMQRIDQELNRTLNLKNVVDITMDWALRKSGATAGVLFIRDRETNEMRILASYGYPKGSMFDMEGELAYSADRGVIGRVVRSAQPSLITNVAQAPDYEETLPNCVAQLTVPLFSANQVIGVIILESDHEGELDLLDLDFVARLAEHASPAIVNAELFSELEHANKDKSNFVSMVAHELKNPMTSMKGYTDLLLKGVLGPMNEQQSDFLRIVLNNVNRMETLVSDLNDLTKQQTGNLRLDIAPVDFRNIVMETLRSLQGQIEEKNQELVVQVPDDLPLVMGDSNRLMQVMTNFISNAYKYTPPSGKIGINAELTRNLWNPQGAPQVIHCSVQDTGIGMDEDDLAKLFRPYFRSENPKTREQPGTGLGLTITRGLIEQHGGQVWVQSELEVGTVFHFTIPVVAEAMQAGA